MTAFDELLELQDLDLRRDQLRHRLDTLPQRELIASATAELAAFDAESERITSERDDLGRQQKRLEDEVAILEQKASETDSTLYGGGVTSPKELQALQAELDMVNARRRQIEDSVIEMMEQVEPLDSNLADRAVARTGMTQRLEECENELDAAAHEIEAELLELDAQRNQKLPSIPGDLVEHYEQLRERLGGIGVAKLTGSTCGGCHLMLSAAELDRVRHESQDALVHCEECGRLLVR